jgi:hypothetical protein
MIWGRRLLELLLRLKKKAEVVGEGELRRRRRSWGPLVIIMQMYCYSILGEWLALY